MVKPPVKSVTLNANQITKFLRANEGGLPIDQPKGDILLVQFKSILLKSRFGSLDHNVTLIF
jgi:hypothetical protein